MQIFCDFDGTITDHDTIVFLTERFGAGPDFRSSILEQIHTGALSIPDAIRLELESVTVGWGAAMEVLDREISVDATFQDFVEWCSREGHPLVVLSSGMESVVRHFVSDPRIPVVAHRVTVDASGWHYETVPENEKVRVLSQADGEGPLVYIGDGASDVCAIPWVDRLFAKQGRYLERHCRNHRVPFTPFGSFAEIRAHLANEPEKRTT